MAHVSVTGHQGEKYSPAWLWQRSLCPIAGEDLGRVIAAIVNDPSEHVGKTYPLYGPKELSQYDVAEILTRQQRYAGGSGRCNEREVCEVRGRIDP